MSTSTKTTFRIKPADSEAVEEIEKNAPDSLKKHFQLIKNGLKQIPGVPEEAVYGAITLRTLALKPEIFKHWFLTEYHSVKEGEIPSKYKEILAYIISERNEGGIYEACTPYHFAAAKYEGVSEDELIEYKKDADNDDLSNDFPAQLIQFGLDVVYNPDDITDEQIKNLRDNGLSDEGFIELVSSALIANNLSIINKVFHLKEGVE